MDEMATSAEQISIAAVRVNEISEENKHNINSVRGLTQDFFIYYLIIYSLIRRIICYGT